jgi:hypothetical protein
MSFNTDEIVKLRSYLENKFRCPGLAMKKREKADDSVEVTLNGEYVGIIHKDTEDGDLSYHFTMTILDIDLEEAA